MPFNTIPSNASLKCKPFQAHVSDEELNDFKTLLKLSKIGPVTYENQVTDVKDFNSFGISRKYLVEAKQHWETKHDWRKCEARINALPNWTTEIEYKGDKFDIHFAALFSKKQDAAPLLLLHGWPGSFLEFIGTLEKLSKKYKENDLPFHVIVPSLPGYGYSSGPPIDKNFVLRDQSFVLDKLMRGLGFESGYIAQGGDVGSFISRVLAVESDACKSAHIHLCIGAMPESDDQVSKMDERNQLAMKRYGDFGNLGNAYAREHGTRPSTIGLVLSASPLALLAWIGEKFLQWSDESPLLDEVLDATSLYWFTNSFPRAIYPYRSFFGPNPTFYHNEESLYIKKPFGYSWHPQELAPVPVEIVAKTGNLVWSREHNEGGHFAAWEKPDLFIKDMEDFVKDVWPKAK